MKASRRRTKKARVESRARTSAKMKNACVRFSDEDRARLRAVAEHYGLSESSALRFLIVREWRALGDPILARRKRKPALENPT